MDALDKGRVERLDGGRGVAPEEGLEVFLEDGLEGLLFPWLLAERLELPDGIIVAYEVQLRFRSSMIVEKSAREH